jgi:hypothetical protein
MLYCLSCLASRPAACSLCTAMNGFCLSKKDILDRMSLANECTQQPDGLVPFTKHCSSFFYHFSEKIRPSRSDISGSGSFICLFTG